MERKWSLSTGVVGVEWNARERFRRGYMVSWHEKTGKSVFGDGGKMRRLGVLF